MIKELIIKYLQQTGYDILTACQLADDKIKELQVMPSGTKVTFQCGNAGFTIMCK